MRRRDGERECVIVCNRRRWQRQPKYTTSTRWKKLNAGNGKKRILSSTSGCRRSAPSSRPLGTAFYSLAVLLLLLSYWIYLTLLRIVGTALVLSLRILRFGHYPFDGELLCSQVTVSILLRAANCSRCSR